MSVRIIAYLFAPCVLFFASFAMFAQWWTALIEICGLGVVAWKFADHYDKHNGAGKFDDRREIGDAIERYAQNYMSRD